MRIQHLRVVCVVFMIMLMISQISSYRHIHRVTAKESKQTDKSESYSRFSWHFSTESPEGSSSRDEIGPRKGVSLREVPQGPNPLHN
ncbi:hypothetical protein CerSpe_179570 [Prunus speciosa]